MCGRHVVGAVVFKHVLNCLKKRHVCGMMLLKVLDCSVASTHAFTLPG